MILIGNFKTSWSSCSISTLYCCIFHFPITHFSLLSSLQWSAKQMTSFWTCCIYLSKVFSKIYSAEIRNLTEEQTDRRTQQTHRESTYTDKMLCFVLLQPHCGVTLVMKDTNKNKVFNVSTNKEDPLKNLVILIFRIFFFVFHSPSPLPLLVIRPQKIFFPSLR